MPNVADLEVNKLDSLGQKVSCIYGRKPPVYGVYGAGRRVMICYSDPDEANTADEQRKTMSELAPLRGEIDGLIDGWRQGKSHSLFGSKELTTLQGKANRYNRRVADALVVALEGDITNAKAILGAVKQDILDDRVAHARFEYLIAAVLAAAVLMFAAWLTTSTYLLVGEVDAAGRTRGVGWILLLLAMLAAFGYGFARWDSEGRAIDRLARDGAAEEPNETPQETASQNGWKRFWKSLVPSALLFAVLAVPISAMLLASTFNKGASESYLPEYSRTVMLWRAAAAGSIGAFFSISIGIRGRTVLPDLLRTANLMDAALRVSIGFIGAGTLEALLILKAVKLDIGGFDLNDQSLLGVIVAGFVAGFSERLVPDLLAKSGIQAASPAPATRPPGPKPGETDSGKIKGQGTTVPDVDDAPEQTGEDGCISDHEISEEDITHDNKLPPASGGVAPEISGPES